jgi:fatty acid desaturase
MEIVTFALIAVVAAISAAATLFSVNHDGYHRAPTRRP